MLELLAQIARTGFFRQLSPAAHFYWALARSNLSGFGNPFKLNLALTYRCNHRCMFCDIWNKPQKAELDADGIDRFLSESTSFCWIHLTGGEIFLRKDLFTIFQVIFKRTENLYLLQLTTNGYLVENIVANVERLLSCRAGIPRIFVGVSIDGPPEVNDQLRGVPKAWENAVETLGHLRRLKHIRAYVGITLSHLNAGLIKDTYLAIKERVPDLTMDDLNLNVVGRSTLYYGNADNENVNRSLSDPVPIIEALSGFMSMRGQSIRPERVLSDTYLTWLIEHLESRRVPFRCRALSSSCFVDPYGDIYPCAFWNRKIGNIGDDDNGVSSVWDSSPASELKQAILTRKCPDCWTPCEAYPSMLGDLRKLLR